jgi:hypothetical protein
MVSAIAQDIVDKPAMKQLVCAGRVTNTNFLSRDQNTEMLFEHPKSKLCLFISFF